MDEHAAMSKNDRAERIMGYRPSGSIAFDMPCELGYHCPYCNYDDQFEGNYDERLDWSEYEGFLYCYTCNKDYPSALCMNGNISQATEVFLSTVEAAVARAGGRTDDKRKHIDFLTQLTEGLVNGTWHLEDFPQDLVDRLSAALSAAAA